MEVSLPSFVKYILVFVLPLSFYSAILPGRTFQSGKMKLYLHKHLEPFIFLLAVIHSYESIQQLVIWETYKQIQKYSPEATEAVGSQPCLYVVITWGSFKCSDAWVPTFQNHDLIDL